MIESFRVNPSKLIVTGYPRTDILYRQDENRKIQIIQKLGIKKKYTKILLYAPTYRKNQNPLPFSREDLIELEKILIEKDLFLLFKAHYASMREDFKPIKNSAFVPKLIDPQEVVYIADILISDYSSIYFDFLFMKKPIILFQYDLKTYLNNDWDTYAIPPEKYSIGPYCSTIPELFHALRTINKWLPDTPEKIEKLFPLFWDWYDDGSSTRVFKTLKIE